MRWIPLTTVAFMFAGGTVSAAPVVRDIRYVQVEVAEVRSGPSNSPDLYPTNRLRKGTAIEVTEERGDGWLKIRPPAGSFSYISTLFLSHPYPDQQNHVVIQEGWDVPVYVGSAILDKKPTVVGVRLQRGTLVVSMGKVINKEGSWMPIVPPDREPRYILAAAVTKTLPPGIVQVGGSAHSTFTPSGNTLPQSLAPSANVSAAATQQMWQRAIQAERAGQLAEAIRLYAQVGADTVNSNPKLSKWALQWASYLQSGYRGYGQGTTTAGTPMVPAGTMTPVSRASGVVAVGTPASQGSIPTVPAYPTPQQRSSFVPGPSGSPPRVANAVWQKYTGVLRKSGRSVEGYQTYVIDDPISLRPLVEVMPARGMNMDAQLMRNVDVVGWTWYRGDLRRNYMNVTYLRPAS